MTTVPTYKRVVVDGIEVRAVKDDASVRRRGYEVKSCYPIYVDGVLRGHLVYRIPGFRSYTSRGWAVRCLLPWEAWNLNALGQDVVQGGEGIDCQARILAKIPSLIAEGRMPTPEECERLVAQAVVRHDAELAFKKQREADYAARHERQRQESAAAAERAEEARLEALQGLYSIRDTHAAMLSNFERAGLQAAIKAMGGTEG